MNRQNLPFAFWDKMDLKFFAVNDINQLSPNLWCICKKYLIPQLHSSSDQYFSFTIIVDNHTLGFVVVYASICNTTRRRLWYDLISFPSNITWCFIGDFNSILGAQDHRGVNNPNISHMRGFKEWTKQNLLIDVPSKGVIFTRYNGRSGRAFVERKLDKDFCNNSWVTNSHTLTVTTLPKLISSYHPIILDSSFTIHRYTSHFRFLCMWTLHDNCQEFIAKVWSTCIVGYPMFILYRKLKILKA
ncbi:unnamed protein product [Lathyrus oleraceus]